jgi:hypothetical protein
MLMSEKKPQTAIGQLKTVQVDFKELWNKIDVEARGLIQNDLAKIMALIMVLIVSYMIITFIPDITFSYYYNLIGGVTAVFIIPMYTMQWASIPVVPDFEALMAWALMLFVMLIFYYGNYVWIYNFVIYALGLLVSIIAAVGFLVLTSWISTVYKIRRSQVQQFFKIMCETVGVAMGMFVVFAFLPYDIFLPSQLLLKYTVVDLMKIFEPTVFLTTQGPVTYLLSSIGMEIAGNILVRTFTVLLTCYGGVLLNDTLFWACRKVRGVKLVKYKPIYEYIAK